MSKGTFKIDEACRHWNSEVSGVALLFERRWTRLALNRVDAELAARLAAQQSLFDSSCLRGTVADIEQHGSAMCRGWLAAIRAMEQAEVSDDAYLIGRCPKTGFSLAIGNQKAAADRVVELHGESVCWVSPDELASIVANVEAFKSIALVKKFFPGAEVIDLHPGEPAKGD